MMADITPPHLDLSRLLLMANDPTVVSQCFSSIAAGRRVEVAAGRLYAITRDASHCGVAIYIIKKYLKAKEELQKLKYFNLQKYNPLKETKILQEIITR
jgi:hypothetical protein